MTELIIALDVPSRVEAENWVNRLGDAADWYKVGMELFTADGRDVLDMLADNGKKVFLDLKFHDIPRTVARAVARAAELGVAMVNIHTVGGKAMMEAAAEELVNRSNPPKLLGVTVLTSMDAKSLGEMGIRKNPRSWVPELAMMAQECGLDGVVASPKELKKIRELCGDGFLIVTPGIRSPSDPPDDQRRTATPKQARAWGASHIVVGRPVLGAQDPIKAITKIRKDLSK